MNSLHRDSTVYNIMYALQAKISVFTSYGHSHLTYKPNQQKISDNFLNANCLIEPPIFSNAFHFSKKLFIIDIKL